MRKFLVMWMGCMPVCSLSAQSSAASFSTDSVSPVVMGYVERFDSLERFPYYGAFNGPGYIGLVDHRFFEFRDTASVKELFCILGHPDPIVKAFAFWALIHKEGVDLMPVIRKHIPDTTHLPGYWQWDHYSDTDYLLCDFFIEKATLFNPASTLEQRKQLDLFLSDFEIAYSGLDTLQYPELDSLLIFTPNRLAHSRLAYLHMEPQEALYPQLKGLYTERAISYALVPLARFKKQEDISLIHAETDTLIKLSAIYEFPDTAFVPFLLQYGEALLGDPGLQEREPDIKDKTFLQCMTRYGLPAVHNLLLRLIRSDWSTIHARYLYGMICEEIKPLFTDLYVAYYERWGYLDLDVYIHLCHAGILDCKDKLSRELMPGARFFETDIAKTSDIYRNSCWGSSDCEMIKLVRLLLERDSASGRKIVAANVERGDLNGFHFFANLAAELHAMDIAEQILRRMKKTDNCYEIDYVVDALLRYEDGTLRKRAIALFEKKKPALPEWGIKMIEETIAEYNTH